MVRNFLFHRVNPVRDPLWDPMDVPLFEKCIKYISEKYSVALFEDIAFTDKIFTKNKYATIMFDDGYKDNIEHAFPILEKYRCKASFYVATDCIDKNIQTWTQALEYAFLHTKKSQIDIDFEFIPEELQISSLPDPKTRMEYARKLKPFIKKLPSHQRQQVLDRINECFSDVIQPKIMMNWDDVRTLQAHGHQIGSHTITHNMLGTMQDEAEVRRELVDSGKRIEEELGAFPMTISYPVGSYNETTKRLSKEAGYQIGLAVKHDIFDPQKSDLFEVERIELYNEPWWKTRMRISNNLERIKKMIGYKKIDMF